MAIENGMTVCALAVAPPPRAGDCDPEGPETARPGGPDPVVPGSPGVADEAPAWDAPAQSIQKTTSQVSQNMSSECE